jgi:hypothetical protein
MADQLTLRQLLADPLYKKWFLKRPTVVPTGSQTPPWFIYILEEGKWRRAQIGSYKKALKWAAKNLQGFDDIVISSKRQAYRPPRYRRNVEGHFEYCPKKCRLQHTETVIWESYPYTHQWCPYCRRPTVFDVFARHHAFTGQWDNGRCLEKPRCTVCGASDSMVQEIMRKYQHR